MKRRKYKLQLKFYTHQTDFVRSVRSVRFRRHEFHNKNLAICSELHSHATFPHFPSCSVGSLQHKQSNGQLFSQPSRHFQKKNKKKTKARKIEGCCFSLPEAFQPPPWRASPWASFSPRCTTHSGLRQVRKCVL